MTRSKRSSGSKVPSYLRHKPSGQARVRIDGKDHYLGPYGSIESHEKYGQLIALKASNVAPVEAATGTDGRTIDEIVLAFMRHAVEYYVKEGEPTGEYDSAFDRQSARW